jgi:hypothetical protein
LVLPTRTCSRGHGPGLELVEIFCLGLEIIKTLYNAQKAEKATRFEEPRYGTIQTLTIVVTIGWVRAVNIEAEMESMMPTCQWDESWLC